MSSRVRADAHALPGGRLDPNDLPPFVVTSLGEMRVFARYVRAQLSALERSWQRNEAARLMREGVSIADPERLDIRGDVQVGEDCFIDVNVVLSGTVSLGSGVRIGPGCVITDSALGDDVTVEPHTVVEGAHVAARCQLGPFRPFANSCPCSLAMHFDGAKAYRSLAKEVSKIWGMK